MTDGPEETTKPRKAPAPPANLAPKARKLWRKITEAYDLRVDELDTLEDACRVVDKIDELERIMRGDGLSLVNARGEVVMHPALRESRQQRALLLQLWKRLGLPDDVDAHPENIPMTKEWRSARAAKAASARWKTAHGSEKI